MNVNQMTLPAAVIDGLRKSIAAIVEHEVEQAKLRCEQRVRETVAQYTMTVGREYSMEWHGTELRLRVQFG